MTKIYFLTIYKFGVLEAFLRPMVGVFTMSNEMTL